MPRWIQNNLSVTKLGFCLMYFCKQYLFRFMHYPSNLCGLWSRLCFEQVKSTIISQQFGKSGYHSDVKCPISKISITKPSLLSPHSDHFLTMASYNYLTTPTTCPSIVSHFLPLLTDVQPNKLDSDYRSDAFQKCISCEYFYYTCQILAQTD